jgi:hypothetical protein
VPADRVAVLKIDKDCFVEPAWLSDYVNVIRRICKLHGVTVKTVRVTRSRSKGQHFYIEIEPSIDPELANRLHWLLGDDCRRVDFNRARIRSHLREWSKLFEEPNRRLTTIYKRPSISTKKPFYIHEPDSERETA